jgi:prostaglandin-endoperoxide synthase 2
MRKNPRSSVLFCFFAQWFTDSFLRTNPLDPRRNTSNHEIDLCQIYGLDEQSTWALRSGHGGLLKSRLVNGCEYPALLFKDGEIDRQFYDPDPVNERGLTYLRGGRDAPWKAALESALQGTISDPARRDYIYASGLDRGSSTVAYSAFNTIFLREHNRIARILADTYPTWEDDRLFETARLVNLRQALNVVVNDYIRHIGGVFPFSLDRTFAERKNWYRTNRISIEFNLLYRWHSLVPDAFTMAGITLGNAEFRYNNALLEKYGVEQLITDASSQHAGRVGLHNTPGFLAVAEEHGLKWARDFGLQPFNRYRERFGLAPYRSIDELADGNVIAAELKRIYNDDVDAVEFTVGLFGEKRGENECMPETLVRMVAYDAFTHILTNPVLSTEVHCPLTYSDAGWNIVQKNSTLEEIVRQNSDPRKQVRVSLSAA